MNTKSKLALGLSLVLAPFALAAKTPESAYVESYHGRTDIPIPVSVVTPDVSPEFAGQQVMIEFVVDTTGKPTLLASTTPHADNELVAAVEDAIKKWRFTPATENGIPVARKVALPVNIVDKPDAGSRFAMK